MFHQIRLVVFDLDYVVMDCSGLKARALRQSLIPFADSIAPNLRLPDPADIEEAFRNHGHYWLRFIETGLSRNQVDDLECGYRLHEKRFLDAGMGRMFAGLPELIAHLTRDGLSLGLGADADREYLITASDQLGMDRTFGMAFCTEEYGMGGAGEMLEEMMAHAEVSRSETVVLATRPAYFEACRNVEIVSVGCGWGIQDRSALAEADYKALSPADIPPVLQQADAVAAGRSA